jgi:hypothetical protein
MKNETLLTRWLEALAEQERKKVAPSNGAWTPRPGCPPVPRFLKAVLYQDWSAEEQAHKKDCRYCQTIEERTRQNTWHPTVAQLFGHLLGRLSEDDARDVNYHLAKDNCHSCQRLAHSPWLARLAALVRAGSRTWEEVRVLLDRALAASAPLPAAAGAFDTAPTQPPFQLRVSQPDGSLTATLGETPEGELRVNVETPDPALARRTVHVEVLGEAEPLTADVVLEPWDGRGCDGHHTFGKFPDLAPRLGADCVLLASLIRPEGTRMGEEPRYLPWVGDRYTAGGQFGVRLLLLGESMYQKGPGSLTPGILTSMIERIIRGESRHKFFTLVYQTVAGRTKRESAPAEVAAFWQSVAFYNYIQSSVGDQPRQRPTEESWAQSRGALVEVVGQIAPQAVLVLGRELWKRLVSLGLVQATGEEFGRLNVGPGAVATFINHPSSPRGFTWQKWHGRAVELLGRARQGLQARS